MATSQYDPWADVGRRGSVELAWITEPVEDFGLPAGLTCFSDLRISLRVGMDSAELRSTLAHELIHLERGPVRPERTDAEEDLVELIAAKRLIDPVAFDALVSASPEPSTEQVKAALSVDWRAFRFYRDWRRGVTHRTSQRVWRTAQVVPSWPPPWFDRYPGMHELAARRQSSAPDENEGCF